MSLSVCRRELLQGGALAGGLATIGLRPQPAGATAVRARPITGVIAGHIRLDFRRGAIIRLTELDGGQPLRDLARLEMAPAALFPDNGSGAARAPLRIVCEEAEDLALRVAAADWGVPPQTCNVVGRQIVHHPSGRFVGYTAWVDVV